MSFPRYGHTHCLTRPRYYQQRGGVEEELAVICDVSVTFAAAQGPRLPGVCCHLEPIRRVFLPALEVRLAIGLLLTAVGIVYYRSSMQP